jgi:phosphatidylglycerol:prolipoprotein diacylglycerol transferase
MSSHGGIIGVALACWRVSRGFKAADGSRIGRCAPLNVMDTAVLIGPIGLFFGRIANFINGELLGKVVAMPGESAPWYAVRYPQEVGAYIHYDRDDGVYTILDEFVQTPEQLEQIQQISMMHMLPNEENWLFGYNRVLELIQKGDEGLKLQLEPLISARYPTQLMQAGLDGLLVLAVVWFVALKPRRPGVVGAWFLLTYGLGRIPMDFVRLADTDVAQFGFMTRGQLYSAMMVILGIVILIWSSRSKHEPFGGLRSSVPKVD